MECRNLVLAICLMTAVCVQAMTQCYSCHSGGVNDYQFEVCPADGDINGWALTDFTYCAGHCVTGIQRYSLGNVIRGCSNLFYNPTSPTPTSGCHMVNGNNLCYCRGNLCNNDNRTLEQADMVSSASG